METNRLIQFRCVVETGNLRKAAEILHISHGALSKSIKVLEEQLSTKLLLPEGRGIIVTEEGMRIYERSQDILDRVDALTTPHSKNSENKIRLATFEVFSTYFFSQLAKNSLDHELVELHELLPGAMEEAIQTKKVDFGITYEPIPTKGIDFLKVTTIETGIYGAKPDLPFAVPIMPNGHPHRSERLGWLARPPLPA